MRVYLAARYSRRQEMRRYGHALKLIGFDVQARWLDGLHESEERGTDEHRRQYAQEDVEDVLAAQMIISFTEAPRSPHRRGGRHVEFGMGIATNKVLVVIGYRENIFHYLPQVIFYPSWIVFYANAPKLL